MVVSLVWLLIFSTAVLSAEDNNQERRFLEFILGNPCRCKCGVPNREARLLGGEFLRGHEFPWLALIHLKDLTAITGTLINNKYILTGASQLIGLTPYDIKVTLGQYDRCFPDISSANLSIDSISIHPDFNPGSRSHDIALLKLSNPINFERRISPVCLSTLGTKYLGQVATVVSWSQGPSTQGDMVSTCRPRKLGLPVLGETECLSTAIDPVFMSVDKGCAGVYGGPSVVCKTDSGGPVLYRNSNGIYEIIGVLTDKNECGPKASTALYTRINDQMRWIINSTRDACYCQRP